MKLNDYILTSKKSLFNLELFTKSVSGVRYGTVLPNELPELWESNRQLADCERLYFSLISQNENTKGNYSVQIDLNKQIRIGRHIINHLLYRHFQQKLIVTFDKIGNVEVWTKSKLQESPQITQYERFSLIPHYNDGWYLTVSYNGISSVYNTSVIELDIQTNNYDIVVGGEVVKNKFITPEQKRNLNEAYPKINYLLGKEFNIPTKHFRNTERYKTNYNNIDTFVKEHLTDAELQQYFIISTEMIAPDNDSVIHVRKDANLLQFANGATGTDPYAGIFGPQPFGIFRPSSISKVKFFFIYQSSDLNTCKMLYDIFTRGLLGTDGSVKSPSLSTCISQQFNTDKNGSICFENLDTAVEEIKKQLHNKAFEEDTQYFAIYISPIQRDSIDSPHHSLYYKIKELLLCNNITSQAIYRERPYSNNFRYHLPNIALGILAKIDGIPWQIYNENPQRELVIGVGAYRFRNIREQYVGTAVSFDSNGNPKKFDGCKSKDLSSIMAGIRRALFQFAKEEDGKIERLIIHYYKDLSKREAKPITEMLHNLGFDIPVIVVTIHKTEFSDLVMFDEHQNDLMPMSGTILKMRSNDYLLYNNSRFAPNAKSDRLFPIRLKIRKIEDGSNSEITNEEASEIITQVYQFSRISWQSVKTQNLPITIKYSEMIAKALPYFEQNALPEFGKNNLWFL